MALSSAKAAWLQKMSFLRLIGWYGVFFQIHFSWPEFVNTIGLIKRLDQTFSNTQYQLEITMYLYSLRLNITDGVWTRIRSNDTNYILSTKGKHGGSTSILL